MGGCIRKRTQGIKRTEDSKPAGPHVSEAELIFTALAELSTRQIAESTDATGMDENEDAGKKGGGIAKKARLELETKTGKKVVTGESFLPPKSEKLLVKQSGDDVEEA
jgi:hypothetical protein